MLTFVGVIGFLGGLGLIVYALYDAIRRRGNFKKILLGAIALMVIGIVAIMNTPEAKKNSEEMKEKTKVERLEREKEQKERKAKEEEEKQKAKAEEQAKKQELSDITKVTETPSYEQVEVLTLLADQQFKKVYPYKGSKIHKIVGVIQDWTGKDGKWFYKATGTIVNAFGAEMEQNIEIHITPESPTSGYVKFENY